MSRYPAGTVAPLSLLVPVVGIAAARPILGETPNAAQLLGAAVAICGAFVSVSTVPAGGGKTRVRQRRPVVSPTTRDARALAP